MVRYLRRLLLCLTPWLAIGVVYLVTDPFRVLYTYPSYYPASSQGGVSLNPGYVSCAVYQQHHRQMGYDSFILGNSRSLYYSTSQWAAELDSCHAAMHMSAAAETLLGLERKLDWIDRQGGTIRNVLFVVDADVLSQATSHRHNHLLMLAPQLCGPMDRLRFQLQNLRVFFTPKFLFAYTDYRLSGRLKPYMVREKLLDDEMFDYDPMHNEQSFGPMEWRIAQGTFYDAQRVALFQGAQYPDSVSPQVIAAEQLQLLTHIQQILARHHAQAQWVISPLYNQIRLNPADVATLSRLFGPTQVHDFSGPNAWNTDYHNYYETSHYRPHVASEIIDQISERP